MMWLTWMLEKYGYTMIYMNNRDIEMYMIYMGNRDIEMYADLYGWWRHRDVWWLYRCMMTYMVNRDYVNNRDIRMYDDL